MKQQGLVRAVLCGTFTMAAVAGAVAPLFPAADGSVAEAAPRFGLRGPSTTVNPYLVPNPALGDMVGLTSILTVGEAVGGYKLAGLPDGMGAFASGNNNLNLLVGHEMRGTVGAARKHGSKGAFVSSWTINSDTLKVEAGADVVQAPSAMYLWDAGKRAYSAGTSAIERLCSGDLAAPGAYWWNGLGTTDRIFPPDAAVAARLQTLSVPVRYQEIDSPYGHMASGVEWRQIEEPMRWLIDGAA